MPDDNNDYRNRYFYVDPTLLCIGGPNSWKLQQAPHNLIRSSSHTFANNIVRTFWCRLERPILRSFVAFS